MKVNSQTLIEDLKAGAVLRILLSKYENIVIKDQPDGIFLTTNDGHGDDGWVKLVYGNGEDILSDYTTNLEELIHSIDD